MQSIRLYIAPIQNRRSTEADLHSSSHYTQANSTIWMLNTVEPLYNGHLGERRNWAFQRGWSGSECMDCQPKKNDRCREVAVVERWPSDEVWPYQELLALTKHCNEGDPLRRNTPTKGVKKLQTPKLLGWFSYRTGTSVDDGARKLNNWPMAERQIGHRKSCLVLSARFPVANLRSCPVA